MGRVETRMYKRKRKRARTLRLVVLAALLVAVVLLLWKGVPNDFISEHIGVPTPTPVTSAFDQAVETREVTLAEEIWYAIQTGVFSTEEAARQKADAYASRGAPGTVVQEGEKWRVFIACYDSEADASAVRNRLESNQKVDTYLYAWSCPEVRLRLTGKAGQLDTVEAGITLLVSAASALRDAAIELDAAQFTTGEAVQIADALDGQITLWEDTARSRFGKSLPDLVQDMMTITTAWDDKWQAIRDAANATELSAALKSQAMGMFQEIIVWRNALLAQ